MAEGNGDRDTRMDRIERALELMIADHEQFRADHKQLLIAQVIQKDQIDKLLESLDREREERLAQEAALKAKDAALDKRVDDLVSAIGDLIRRIPPESLKREGGPEAHS
jgi:hypothetical protein